jgi:hypothetical protein
MMQMGIGMNFGVAAAVVLLQLENQIPQNSFH